MKLYLPKYWLAWLVAGVLRVIVLLPWRLQISAGRFLGGLLFKLDKGMRQTTQTNIKLCFPELSANEQNRLIRDTFKSAGIAIIETANGWWGREKSLPPVQLHGLEHLQTALAHGNGVLLLGSHQSTLHLIGRMLVNFHAVNVVYRKQHNAVFNWISERALNHYYQKAIPREDLFSVRRALKNNQVVWYSPDTDPRDKASLFAPFFNINAATVVVPSRFARTCQAALVPISYYRDENDCQYHINIGEAISPISNSDADNMTRINAWLETEIRKHPAQYFWQYKRFKTRPPGQPNPYKLTDDNQLEMIK